MPLLIIRNDITKTVCDAIVNAANSTLLGGGGVDGAIHRAAGRGITDECRTLGGCKTGNAKITKGYNLPCKYVIHTVGPIWQGGNNSEKKLLESCYKNSLTLAMKYNCQSVAFPVISAGAYGYPKDKAIKVAVDTISDFLLENDMTVYLVVYDNTVFSISKGLFSDIEEYIDSNYVEEHTDFSRRSIQAPSVFLNDDIDFGEINNSAADDTEQVCSPKLYDAECYPCMSDDAYVSEQPECMLSELEDAIKMPDESFSQMLLRKIDEKGMTDTQCYKKANIDRKLFSKIRSDINYRPSKTTALAFAIALELPLTEAKDMLLKAGYALSHSNKFDIIIEYFITKGNYNIFEINEALFSFDQSLLGC